MMAGYRGGNDSWNWPADIAAFSSTLQDQLERRGKGNGSTSQLIAPHFRSRFTPNFYARSTLLHQPCSYTVHKLYFQVDQTSKRMREWGGQGVDSEKLQNNQPPFGNGQT